MLMPPPGTVPSKLVPAHRPTYVGTFAVVELHLQVPTRIHEIDWVIARIRVEVAPDMVANAQRRVFQIQRVRLDELSTWRIVITNP